MNELKVSNGIYWFAAVTGLGVLTFGILGVIYAVLYFVCFIGGIIAIVYDKSKKEVTARATYLRVTSAQITHPITTPVQLPVNPGIAKVLEIDYSKRDLKADKRLTGSLNIDNNIHECLEFLLRDYVKYWYNDLSDDPEFLHDFRVTLYHAIRAIAMRCKSIDWQPYLTTTLVDDFATHVKLFRKAEDKYNQIEEVLKSWNQRVNSIQNGDGADENANTNQNHNHFGDNSKEKESVNVLDLYFQYELKIENVCRELVACDTKKQCEFLQDICEVLMYLLLPKDDFLCRPLKHLMREIMVHGIFLPLFNLYSDPDYLNQYINWLISDNCVTSEWFLLVLRQSKEVDELQSVSDKAQEDITRIRSKDTVGDDLAIKQQLSSMRYVKQLCDRQIRKHHEGFEEANSYNELKELEGYQTEKAKLYNLPLSMVLRNNIALQMFIEYMQSVNGQAYLFFWLTVDGYRASAEQQLNEIKVQELHGSSNGAPNMEMLRAIGYNIYDQYLSKHAEPRVPLDPHTDKQLRKKLDAGEPSPYLFDDIQKKVFQTMLKDEGLYPAFRSSPLYLKLLAELDLLRESSLTSGDTNGSISNSSLDGMAEQELEEPYKLTAVITQTGICTEHGKTYALYAITVTRHWVSGKQECWDTFRRYREFSDLHLSLKENGSHLSNTKLPGKTFFKDLKEDFLEKRRFELNNYLHGILTMDHSSKAMECLHTFLDNKAYQRNSKTFARKVDTMMRTSVRNMTNFVQQAPDNFIDGIQKASDKMSDGLQKFSDRLPGERRDSVEDVRLSEQMEYNIDNNIPLGILLLLMDEVFDLKQRNQWLRRQLVAVLQQIIRAIFGDRMNKKIVDYVDNAVSAEQVGEYIQSFRDAFWPGGVLAEVLPPRDSPAIMRTRVLTKTKLHGVIPDELRPLVGNETSSRGMNRMFEMTQHTELNQRFCYVLLEGVLKKVFPENSFSEMFEKFHANSPKTRALKREKMSSRDKTRPNQKSFKHGDHKRKSFRDNFSNLNHRK